MRRTLATLLLLALSMAACGDGGGSGDDPDDVAGWRDRIRSTAATMLPDLAARLDAQVGTAEGAYRASGGGVSDRTFAYEVVTTLTGGRTAAADVEKALDDLGFEVSSTAVPNGTTSITATKGGTSTLVTVPDAGGRPLAVTVTSPFVDVPDDEARSYEQKVAKEPLALD